MPSTRRSIDQEIHLELDWQGPFSLDECGRLGAYPMGPDPSDLTAPGLYIAVSDFPLRGPRSLLYIGQSKLPLSQRLRQHKWLSWEWNLEIYVAEFADEDAVLLDDAESLLIRAHLPAANTQQIGRSRRIANPLRIWNIGRFWGLFPEVSSQHEWNRDSELAI